MTVGPLVLDYYKGMKTFKGKKFEIAYRTWGQPTGQPILFFHGFPGSHIQASSLGNKADTLGLFIISCDRPGYGGTKGRGSHFNFLDDMKALIESLEVKRLSILGVSGGAPWAHVFASRFHSDVEVLKIVCGLCPYSKNTKDFFSTQQQKGLALRKYAPAWSIEMGLKSLLKSFDPKKNFTKLLNVLTPIDREVMNEPDNMNMLFESIDHARAQHGKGIIFDAALYIRDWLNDDCNAENLKSIPTHYFHGGNDVILDTRMSEYMHERNPKSRLHIIPDEGHYSLPFRQADFVLNA